MKAGWNLVQLGELTEPSSPITYGVIKPGEEGDVLFVRGGDISDGNIRINQLRTITREISEQYSRTLLKGGELLMCLVGQPGQVAIAPHHLAGANIARQVGLIRLQSNLNAEFIKYFLQSPDGQQKLGAQTGGSVQQVINLSDLRTIEIPLPSAAEQQRIVAILDEALAAISAARANAEQNRQNARALFESYLQSVFSQRGDGWVEKRLEEIGTTQTGSTPKSSDQSSYGNFIPFVKPGDFNPDGSLNYENGGLSETGTATARKVQAGSALMVCIGATIGKAGFCDRAIATNQQINSFTPNELYCHKFIYYQMITHGFQQRVIHASGQATLPIINKSKWSALTVAVPPTLDEQHKIVGRLDALRNETQRLESLYQRKIAALDELKQSLLQQAFSGQL